MRVWTYQNPIVLDILNKEDVFHCDPIHSDMMDWEQFKRAYDWLVDKMKKRIGPPPDGVIYPIWAHHTFDWKHAKPDGRILRRPEPSVCFELEIPDHLVVLTDENCWDFVLNNWYHGTAANEKDWEKEEAWFDNLSPSEQERIKKASWEDVFNIEPCHEPWRCRGQYVQATFWEIRREYVVRAWKYKGYSKSK